MADINVERKSGSIWPWILGALALLLVLWLLFSLLGRDRTATVDQTPVGVVGDTMAMAPAAMPMDTGMAMGMTGTMPAEVQQFAQACAAPGTAQQQASLSHEYTVDCTRRLTAAIEAVVRRDTVGGAALEPRLAEMRQRVEAIGSNPQATNHANLVRDAFTSIATVMNSVRESRPGASPALGEQVSGVREAAQGISPTTELLNQKNQVDTFFQRAGEALRSMAA
ncbi:MAG: hypothetical protein M3409_02455 [Gemmatimonadota bacterium]|nr:hypothetical protein [Gemmatimonadota bacterium]